MFGKLGRALDRAAFRPYSLPADMALGIALIPPLVAGLILYGLIAFVSAVLALAMGGAFHLLARRAKIPLRSSPAITALIGVALVGAGAHIVWSLLIAVLASLLELLRGRFWPRAGIHTGLIAYAFAYWTSSGTVATYLKPVVLVPFPEPIQQWSRFYGGDARFIDPTTLYVGNVAGPILCTSLLAVVISIAWLWYARRVSLAALIGFLLGGLLISVMLRWDPVFQLDSGPTWFVAALALADRRLLPEEPVLRPTLAFAAGVFAVGVRAVPLYIEGVFLSVAALQVAFALLELGTRWLTPRLPRLFKRGQSRRREPASA